jgi:light-regulated signal transduction histidine kinase (bacteriophytochrome)
LAKTYDKLKEANNQLEKDIIARKKAEREVIHLNRVLEQRVKQRTSELEAANKELDSFCYSVSHDLRAPLRRVEGFRKIFSDSYHAIVDTKGQHYLSRIEAGTREMAEMIDSFLQLARNTQGEMNVKPHNISEIAKAAISKIREREPERNAIIDIQESMHANVDNHFFEGLLNNLLENAWKYSRNKNPTKIIFSEDNTSGESIYCIEDNGAGFDMAYADRLFSPFSRLHKHEDFEGVGVGLATVQRIIARHGGKVWAKSSPLQGAKFYFSLWSKDNDNEK